MYFFKLMPIRVCAKREDRLRVKLQTTPPNVLLNCLRQSIVSARMVLAESTSASDLSTISPVKMVNKYGTCGAIVMSLTLFIYACYKMNIRKFIFVIFFAQSPWIFNLNNMRYIEEMNAHVWWMRFLVKVKTWREKKKAPVTFYRFMLVTQRYIIWLTMMSNFLERFHAKKRYEKCWAFHRLYQSSSCF